MKDKLWTETPIIYDVNDNLWIETPIIFDVKHYNNDDADIEQFKERLSYLMPYSHKHGPDDVLPSLQDRNRCQSVPSMTPEVKPTTTTLERQCRIFDDDDDEEDEDDDDGDGEKNTTLLENLVQSSSLVGCSDGDDQGKNYESSNQ